LDDRSVARSQLIGLIQARSQAIAAHNQVTGLAHLLTLNGRQFEVEMVNFLKATGYRDVKHIGGPGDLGVDIICKDSTGTPVAVQCKRYAPGRSIGSPDIQKFFGMIVHRGVSRGIYVTTSSFTTPAQKLASTRDIVLIDGAKLGRHYRYRSG
jgi:restriction system protein